MRDLVTTGLADQRLTIRRVELSDRLSRAGRVTQVSAPAGSGKTLLLRAWIREAGIAECAGWVSVPCEERDPQRFWASVVEALRATPAGKALVRPLPATPELDGWAMVDRLLDDLGPLRDRLWLVIDDVHELRSTDALRQLELLLVRAPSELRLVLATRHELRLGLHRLRLEGGLTEIRMADLRFTVDEARALMKAAGVVLSERALGRLVARTEGWAAGLRLAAMSLAGHPYPEAFADEFSGGVRTVAEYLSAEVLDRQPEQVRRLLVRTSVLEQVNGPLADVLTGQPGGEGILQDLERANAFVASVGAGRSWFRYHPLFVDLLQLELRRTAPAEMSELHAAAAAWFAEQRHPVEAVRHAQAAGDWGLAARLLSDHMLELVLDGQTATVRRLLAAFPPAHLAADSELTALAAAAALSRGPVSASEQHLALAARNAASLPAHRRGRFEIVLSVLRLRLARERVDLPAVVKESRRLLAPAEAVSASALRLGEDLRAVALINLGSTQLWTDDIEEAERHLEEGVALARRVERPYLEVAGLGHLALAGRFRSFALAIQRGEQAVELAGRHGWCEQPIIARPYLVLGAVAAWQGRLDDADRWHERTKLALPADIEPATGRLFHHLRGLLHLARGRDQEALGALQAGVRAAEMTLPARRSGNPVRAELLHTLVRLGDTDRVEQALADMTEQQREAGEMQVALAVLRLAQHDPRAARAALAPVLARSPAVSILPGWPARAHVLEAIACDALGDGPAADHALERALELAEPDHVLLPFLLHPAEGLLERHAGRCAVHGVLASEILVLLAGGEAARQRRDGERLGDSLSEREARVLRYLPSNMTASEIAAELFLSVHTVKTHMRHIYAKLGVHRRSQAVARARARGVL